MPPVIPTTSRTSFSAIPKEGGEEFTTSIALSTDSLSSDSLLEGQSFYWKITGIEVNDLLPGYGYALVGSGTLSGGKFAFKTALFKDSVQENEVFTVGVYADQSLSKQIGLATSSVILGDIGSTSNSSARTTKLDRNISQLILTGKYTINGTGNDLNNFIQGNDSSNILDGGFGNDVLVGGAGNDTYIVDSVYDTVIEGSNAGIDTISSSVSWSLGSNIENLTLTGRNAISGTGNAANNAINGNDANNILDGGAGNDILVGGGGDDTYIVDSIGDVVRERFFQGTDTVQSSVSWTLGANLENLVLAGVEAINGNGNSLSNSIVGNSADNTLDGGAGNDRLSGGLGNDTYVVDSTGDSVIEEVDAGIDTVRTSVSWTLGGNLENLTLSGKKAISGTGNSLNNMMLGNVANNVLSGGSGDDIIDGGGGTDTLLGGNGNDTYLVDTVTDVITELAGEGVDIVRSSVSFALGANVENLFLSGTAITGTGNSLNNVLTGNAANNILQGGGGNDVLDGGDGNDTLVGGVGDDIYVVNTTTDVITEETGSGMDTVQSSVSFLLSSAANVENLTLTGVSAINGTGNLGNNIIIGNAGSNVIDGGGGIDTLVGGSGNDTYLVDTATDVITEAVGEGIDTVQSSVSFALGDNVENLILTDSAITGTGNSLNNVLTGNASNNILQGGGGSDTLVGGSGNDTYLVDTTTDTITELASGGTDTIQSTVSFSLAGSTLANVENLTLNGTAAIDGTGNLANNVVIGNSGNNVIDGGGGTDVLSGLGGADTFYFSTMGTLGVGTATHISDFNTTEGDLIKISRSAFGIASGTNVTIAKITSSTQLGTALGSANTFVYDSSNGNLYWNQDGATTTGAGSGGVFAVLDNRADLDSSNIVLV